MLQSLLVCELARRSQTQRASTEAGADQACTRMSFIPGSEGLTGFNREYLTGVLNKVKVSGKGKREEPSIRIRDESLTSLGFRLYRVQALVKQMQDVKFQSFILSSQRNAMCQRFISMVHQVLALIQL